MARNSPKNAKNTGTKDAVTSQTKPEKKPPFTMEMTDDQGSKLGRIQVACMANGIRASQGCIMRALLENVAEEGEGDNRAPGIEVLGMIRIQADAEKAAMLEKRRNGRAKQD